MTKLTSSARARVALLAVILLAAAAAGAWAWIDRTPEPVHAIEGGDVERGRDALQSYGCISCHSVPGVRGPGGHVGPPLDDWAKRIYIAGTLPNTPENLILWIQNPQSVEPGTAMPFLGVTEADARDMAAYLYTLD